VAKGAKALQPSPLREASVSDRKASTASLAALFGCSTGALMRSNAMGVLSPGFGMPSSAHRRGCLPEVADANAARRPSMNGFNGTIPWLTRLRGMATLVSDLNELESRLGLSPPEVAPVVASISPTVLEMLASPSFIYFDDVTAPTGGFTKVYAFGDSLSDAGNVDTATLGQVPSAPIVMVASATVMSGSRTWPRTWACRRCSRA
jgi:hypothetical protein